MVQVPSVSIVATVAPAATEQTPGVLEVNATVRPEDAVADSGTGVELKGRDAGAVNEIVCVACPDTDSTKFWIADPLAFVAVMVTLNGPVPAVGFPDSTPVDDDSVTVAGSPVAENVIGVLPLAVTLNVLATPAAKVAEAVLVNVGVNTRLSVKLAVRGASVGTVVPPQVVSASTAAAEVEARLITYEAAVDEDWGARSKVASNWLAVAAIGVFGGSPTTVPPKSAVVAGLLIGSGVRLTSLLGSG